MRVKVLQYREGDTPAYIYKKEGAFIFSLKRLYKKGVSQIKQDRQTFMIDNLYVCRVGDLCLYPGEETIFTKVLWFHNNHFVDPVTGNDYFYDDELRDFINVADKTFLVRNLGKVEEKVKGVKERYSQFLRKHQIQYINKKLNKF